MEVIVGYGLIKKYYFLRFPTTYRFGHLLSMEIQGFLLIWLLKWAGCTHKPISQTIIFVLDTYVRELWSHDLGNKVLPYLADFSVFHLCAQVHHHVANAQICCFNVSKIHFWFVKFSNVLKEGTIIFVFFLFGFLIVFVNKYA